MTIIDKLQNTWIKSENILAIFYNRWKAANNQNNTDYIICHIVQNHLTPCVSVLFHKIVPLPTQ